MGEKKIASIGVGIKKWITFHGFSFNIDVDLHYFSLINPCGLNSDQITSLSKVLKRAVLKKEVNLVLQKKFADVFNVNVKN